MHDSISTFSLWQSVVKMTMTSVCVAVLFIACLDTLATAQNGVTIMLKGDLITPGASVCIDDIGEGPTDDPMSPGDALVCMTTNTNCCRSADTGGSAIGDWFMGDNVILGLQANPGALIHRSRGTGLLRLNHRGGSNLAGEYCCDNIPGADGMRERRCVNLDDTGTGACLTPGTTEAVTTEGTTEAVTTEGTMTTETGTSVTTGGTTTGNSTAPDGGGNTGSIVGAVFGVILLLAVAILVVVLLSVFLSKRMKKSHKNVESLQTAMLETKNQNVSGIYYSSIDKPISDDSALYAEVDNKPQQSPIYSTVDEKVKKSTSVVNGAPDPSHTYAVPDKDQTYVNTPQNSVPRRDSDPTLLADSEYAVPGPKEPSVPKKSAQLEEYLETKPVDEFTHSYNGYAQVNVLRPKAHTLQALSKPLVPASMSDNPLYDQSSVRRAKSISVGSQHEVLSDNLYADPILPSHRPANQKDTESIYKTIYSESIQPSSFKKDHSSPAKLAEGSALIPYSSIYTLPTSPVPQELLLVGPDNIQHIQDLGNGNFGKVILAKTAGLSLKQLKLSKVDEDKSIKMYVAVKMLKPKAASSIKEAFEKEYKFMSRLDHPCVIRMLGVCKENTPFIMMEYMEKGDLNQYLMSFKSIEDSRDPKAISTGVLVYIATQIASGMEYLAQNNFVHRDLATRNCLVGQNNIVKVADFGMSRNLYDSHYYVIQGHAVLPIRWMSTECFYGKFSAKSDVWAFGVTMWEIFTLAKEEPYNGTSDMDLVEDAVRGDQRTLLACPQDCPSDVFRVMEECWVHEPKERATFEDVFSQLSSLNFKYSSQ